MKIPSLLLGLLALGLPLRGFAAPPSLPATFELSKLAPDASYPADRGYGFEKDTKPNGDAPFFFSVQLPEGNYKVTVTFGDDVSDSDNTVKAELRRLAVPNVHTDAGKTETRAFIVNTRLPEYPGGKVKLKAPRETVEEVWNWDDKLTLEFNGKKPRVRRIEIDKAEVPTVYLLGDSTVCDQPGEPYASWGQMLTAFFKPDVAVANHAESGEAIKSSTGAHRLDKILSLMKNGDYLFIQFGHNDMKDKAADALEQYKTALKSWVAKVKEKGGTPVLVTSMNRHSFDGDKITNSLGKYPDTVRDVAKEENVALVDLNAMSKTLYEALGPKDSIALFAPVANGGKSFDGTHHSNYGAYELAKCVIKGIGDAKLDLASNVIDGFSFDPAKPDPADSVNIPPSPKRSTTKPAGS